jgi:amidase
LSRRTSGKKMLDPASLVYAPASVMAKAIAKGSITSLAITKEILHRVDVYNPRLNAIVTLRTEDALREANEADEVFKTGGPIGPLQGVPITIKDCFEMKGVRTTAGTKTLADYIPDRDAAVVERMKTTGAIIIGHTNVPELAADWQTYNSVFGTTNNPWDLMRTPGGSTGGGAAALAAGMTFLEIGSDIGGSIRVPSHFCGLYGHKPSLDVVSTRGHIPPLPGASSSYPAFSVAGPLARSACDLRLALEVLGGPDYGLEKALKWRLPPQRKHTLREYRLGCVIDDPLCRTSSEVRGPLEKLVRGLKEEGIDIATGWPEGIEPKRLFDDYRYMRYASGAGGLSSDQINERLKAEPINDGSDEYAAAQAYASTVKEFQDVMARTAQAKDAWRDYFKGVDALLVPVAFVPAFPHDHRMPLKNRVLQLSEGPRRYQELRFWICFATLCGLPSTVAPIGLTSTGLPVGIQIIGPFMEDATSIDIAEKLGDIVGGFRPPPGF